MDDKIKKAIETVEGLKEEIKNYSSTLISYKALSTLLDYIKKTEKHNCIKWAEEGQGCSICSQRLPNMSKQDIIDAQEYCNGIISSLREELKQSQHKNNIQQTMIIALEAELKKLDESTCFNCFNYKRKLEKAQNTQEEKLKQFSDKLHHLYEERPANEFNIRKIIEMVRQIFK